MGCASSAHNEDILLAGRGKLHVVTSAATYMIHARTEKRESAHALLHVDQEDLKFRIVQHSHEGRSAPIRL